jgi:hypothetical protein
MIITHLSSSVISYLSSVVISITYLLPHNLLLYPITYIINPYSSSISSLLIIFIYLITITTIIALMSNHISSAYILNNYSTSYDNSISISNTTLLINHIHFVSSLIESISVYTHYLFLLVHYVMLLIVIFNPLITHYFFYISIIISISYNVSISLLLSHPHIYPQNLSHSHYISS